MRHPSEIYRAVVHFFAGRTSGQLLYVIILAQIILHLPFIDLPPAGQHTWRQAMGLTATRNYFSTMIHSFIPLKCRRKYIR